MIEPADRMFLIIGILVFTLAMVFKLSSILAPTPIDKHYRNRFSKLFLTIGLAEIIWYGARVQDIKIFGTHLAAILVLLIGLIWLIMVVIAMVKNYRHEKVGWEKEQVRLKYLPK